MVYVRCQPVSKVLLLCGRNVKFQANPSLQQRIAGHFIIKDALPVQQFRNGLRNIGVGLIRIGNGHGIRRVTDDSVDIALNPTIESDFRSGQGIFVFIRVQLRDTISILRGASRHDV